MASRIAVQVVGVTGTSVQHDSVTRVSLLPGAIGGVETNYYLQGTGTGHSPSRYPARGQIFLFTRGAGEIQAKEKTFRFSEIAAFVAPENGPVLITATAAPVEYLEVLMNLQHHEAAQLRRSSPLFTLYSQCEPYTEEIKSPRKPRQLLPPGSLLLNRPPSPTAR